MTQKLNIAIAGVAGRMGRQIASAALAGSHTITGATEAAGSDALDSDVGVLAGAQALGLKPTTSIADAIKGADCWIDFTRPAATLNALEALIEAGVKSAVIGTTGFSDDEEEAIKKASAKIAIMKSGNYSLGVNLLAALTKMAAARLGADWDIEILETHHRRKVDAPSGTALLLGDAAADGRGSQRAL